MTKHVTQWLEAYYDGELKGRRVQQVEIHMESCEVCRTELESLNTLSALLQEFPSAQELTSNNIFTAQVGLRLPRKSSESNWKKFFRTGWQWIPVGLLAAWIFIQTAFLVSGILSWALRFIPGMEQLPGFLQSNPQGTSFVETVSSLTGAGFSEIGQFGLDVLRGGGPLGWAVTINIGLTVILGLLYLSWLASWWVQKSNGNKPSSKL